MWKRGKQAIIEADFSNSIGGREWKFCLVSHHSVIQCFCHAFKAWNLKNDTTEMTAATNKDCIGWLLENCCLMGKKLETFDCERFKSIKGDFSDGANE